MEIKDTEYVYPVEVLRELEDKEEENLTHEQKIALENLKRNIQVDDIETLKELYKELDESVEKLKNKHIYKILEVMPEHESTVKTMFSKERLKIEDTDIEQILEITNSLET